jgi:hypothetical protein
LGSFNIQDIANARTIIAINIQVFTGRARAYTLAADGIDDRAGCYAVSPRNIKILAIRT